MAKTGGQRVKADVYKILSHPARRAIIKLLYERVDLTYSQLLKEIGMDEGRFNFHLRLVKELAETTEDGRYTLSHAGRVAYSMISLAEKALGVSSPYIPPPTLRGEIISRRIGAFLIDGLIFFVFSGVIFDPFIWTTLGNFFFHLYDIAALHPWIFHPEHVYHISELTFRVVAVYSHVFFAVFITLTLLDAYKGQTPGRYLMRIRVVSISNRRLDIFEAGVRNIGKVFLLPLDLLIGVIFFRKQGYIKFSDYYTQSKIEKVGVIRLESPARPVHGADEELSSAESSP